MVRARSLEILSTMEGTAFKPMAGDRSAEVFLPSFLKFPGKTWKPILFFLPFPFLAAWLAMKKIRNVVYYLLITEDGVLEYSQFVFFMAGSVIAWRTAFGFLKARRRIHGILYSVFAAALLLIAMDEISLGQRLFSYGIPEYFKSHNVQQEITVHNIDLVQPLLMHLYVAVGLYGAFAWILLRKLPERRRPDLRWFVPDGYFAFYFLASKYAYTASAGRK